MSDPTDPGARKSAGKQETKRGTSAFRSPEITKVSDRLVPEGGPIKCACMCDSSSARAPARVPTTNRNGPRTAGARMFCGFPESRMGNLGSFHRHQPEHDALDSARAVAGGSEMSNPTDPIPSKPAGKQRAKQADSSFRAPEITKVGDRTISRAAEGTCDCLCGSSSGGGAGSGKARE